MFKLFLLSALLTVSPNSMAGATEPEDIETISARFKADINSQYAVSLSALTVLLERSAESWSDYNCSSDEETWNSLQELSSAGYIEISVQPELGSDQPGITVCDFITTKKGNTLRGQGIPTPFGISIFALIELVQRSSYVDGYDFVGSAEKSRVWPFLQELSRAGYMRISIGKRSSTYMPERELYIIHSTTSGNALRCALLPTALECPKNPF
jgi:hypothetical protein